MLGGGVVGGYACHEFVQQKVEKGKVLLLGNEGVLPYERPGFCMFFFLVARKK